MVTEDDSHGIQEVNPEQFRERSLALFRLCEAWLAGSLTNVELLERTTRPPRRTLALSRSAASLDTVLQLSREFEHALGCSTYIHAAIDELQHAGVGDNPAAAIRAVYFARQVEVMQHVLALNTCIR